MKRPVPRAGSREAACAPALLIHPRHRKRREGISLIEAVVTVAILGVGAMTSISVLTSSLALDQVNNETAAALSAVNSEVELIRSEPFATVSRQFDAIPANDPGGAGTGLGAAFTASGLKRTGSASPGEVVLPVDGGGVVRENLDIPELGMPMDLNGDGVVDAGDHTADAIVLPILVRVQWNGRSGSRAIVVRTVLHK